jgi:hypothetical protein
MKIIVNKEVTRTPVVLVCGVPTAGGAHDVGPVLDQSPVHRRDLYELCR